jgi:3-mercaptopyruvate sulfurtransferase SseA
VALLLRKHGVKRIRPLLGGLEAWRGAGYPIEAASPGKNASIEQLTQISK